MTVTYGQFIRLGHRELSLQRGDHLDDGCLTAGTSEDKIHLSTFTTQKPTTGGLRSFVGTEQFKKLSV